jgi:hypothetical protein
MDKKRLAIVVALSILIVSLTAGLYYYKSLQQMFKPSWLTSDAYMVYEQAFTWTGHNHTEYMAWNVTGTGGDFISLYLISHGVGNVTNEDVETTVGEANWTVNAFTRKVISCSDSNYTGKKWAFWIPTNVRLGSWVDISFGVNTISGSESISVLGKQRDCWVMEYDWPTSDMKRWFDKQTGICLKIHVTLHKEVTISITETAVQTNINFGP